MGLCLWSWPHDVVWEDTRTRDTGKSSKELVCDIVMSTGYRGSQTCVWIQLCDWEVTLPMGFFVPIYT